MPTPIIHSIAEVTAYIKSRFEADELLRDVWLTGEVSNFKQHTSGHCYLTLKDETTSIKAIIWRTTAARLSLPRDGDAVIVRGYISVYEPQGAYQLYINHLEPAGLGRLWAEFERLRARLARRGIVRRGAQTPAARLAGAHRRRDFAHRRRAAQHPAALAARFPCSRW